MKSDDGKWIDKNDIPTFKVEPDGTVDWYTYVGFTRYSSECLRCHGPDGMGSSYAPALMESMKRLSYTDFYAVVASGKKDVSSSQNLVMPANGETRTSCASSMRSTSICARAPTMPSGEAVRRSMRRSPRRSPRPRTNAWVDRRRWGHADCRGCDRCCCCDRRPGRRPRHPGLGASVELVDPKTFRVCADPRNLPFSNEAGEGFENKLAELFARKLGEPASYTYYPQVIGFVRNTLNALRCDVIMGVAIGDNLVQTTNPYYHTTYALVFKPDSGLDGIESLEDPRLKEKHIGIVAGTPPATVLVQQGLMALARPYALTVDTRIEAPTQTMVEDIAAGQIDAGVLWGPIAGYYATRVTPHLVVVPLLKEHEPMEFRIAMGVRRSDQDWKRRLNRLIAESQPEIDRILSEYGVPLLDEQGKLTAP